MARLVEIRGVVDESFQGFGEIHDKSLVIDVSRMTRMTSFGVRRWLSALEQLPAPVTDLYLLGCPTFFVDQLNMVLGFGGSACILTSAAPYRCAGCAHESDEMIDVLMERPNLVKGVAPVKVCPRCSGALELDESPESYFSFATRYTASSVTPDVAQLLAERGLYTTEAITVDKPPRVIKLVHNSVTYFRVSGTINSLFKARPFLVGAEGEIVIDLAEVDDVDPGGISEWRRMLKTLANQVSAVTLVDVGEQVFAKLAEQLHGMRSVYVASVLVPYACTECARVSPHSHSLQGDSSAPLDALRVCPACGGASTPQLAAATLEPYQRVATNVPPASAQVLARRAELVSRAITDANVAKAGDAAMALPDDAILGKYKIVRRLSAGGMAEVFLATQIGIGGFEKPVALKRIQHKLLQIRQTAIDMFLNEAKIVGRLTHPNIVQVLDVGEVGGALYFAMEYVRGKDLREVIHRLRAARVRMPLGLTCHIIRELANALHHAYWAKDLEGRQLSVVHRDVTPHNVLIGFDGQIKLVDFGVAMSAVTEQSQGMIVGKWSYMSPEHSHGHHLDHRSDLFSLGIVLYLLATGSLPFLSHEPKEIVAAIRQGAFTPPQEVEPSLPPRLAALITRMLAPAPAARPQTGQEVTAELEAVMREERVSGSAAQMAELLGDLFGEEQVVRASHVDAAPTFHQPGLAAVGARAFERHDSFGSDSRSLPPGSVSESLVTQHQEPPTEVMPIPLPLASTQLAVPEVEHPIDPPAAPSVAPSIAPPVVTSYPASPAPVAEPQRRSAPPTAAIVTLVIIVAAIVLYVLW